MTKFFNKILIISILLGLIYVSFSTASLSQSTSQNRADQKTLNENNEYIITESKLVTFLDLPSKGNKSGTGYDELFEDALRRIRVGYVEEVEQKGLIESAINGMLTSLDPHSSYLTAEDFKEMQVQTKGEFGGLGIEIISENSMIKVISPIEGTPAYKAGIKSGDFVTHVNNESIIGLTTTEAVKKMRGKVGSKVKITVARKGEKEPLEFKITRGNIKIKAVRGHREGDIIYVRISTFSERVYKDITRIIEKYKLEIGKKNIKGLVLDIRNNPGGLLNQSVLVSDAFLDKDQTILSVKGREEETQQIYKAKQNELLIPNIPMVVLINEGSASASEIVAGALQDNNRAIVMGTKSFGKGSVQSVIPMEKSGGALKMTIARYYTPSGRSIQATGIEPDVKVDNAKIEIIENKWRTSEADLNGHLKNDKKKKDSKDILSSYNKDLYAKDYQLARAIDLLMGVNLYKKIGIKE
jgi:carboxyl-terminal processing protease